MPKTLNALVKSCFRQVMHTLILEIMMLMMLSMHGHYFGEGSLIGKVGQTVLVFGFVIRFINRSGMQDFNFVYVEVMICATVRLTFRQTDTTTDRQRDR